MVILITGGVRSGKSRFASTYAAQLGESGLFVATAIPGDAEMRERIRRHQEERAQAAFHWETAWEAYDLSGCLRRLKEQWQRESKNPVILVDCLTLWLSNWLLRHEHDQPMEKVSRRIEELTEELRAFPGTILLVSNEVGYGLVPDYLLGRQFRDLSGIMNQSVAAVSDQVFLVTAGIPLEIKSRAFHIPGRCP